MKSGDDALGTIQEKAFEAKHGLFGVLRGQFETYAHAMRQITTTRPEGGPPLIRRNMAAYASG